MDTKVCSNCNLEKTADMFSRYMGRLSDWCIKCKDELPNAYCLREKKHTRYDNRKLILRDTIIRLKSVQCLDCGIQYPHYIMQFHHLNPTEKSMDMNMIIIPKLVSVGLVLQGIMALERRKSILVIHIGMYIPSIPPIMQNI